MADNPSKNPVTLGEMLRASRWASDLTEAEFAWVETGVIAGLLKLSSDLVTGKTATSTAAPGQLETLTKREIGGDARLVLRPYETLGRISATPRVRPKRAPN